ncbi:MAG: class I SAM-dependent methyltransferase [Pseudolabrys sp.]
MHMQPIAARIVRRIFQSLLDSERITPISERNSQSGSTIEVQLPNLYQTIRILLRPDLGVGQSYVEGHWHVQPERLFEFLYLIRSRENSRLQNWYLIANRIHLFRDALKQRVFPIRSTRAVVDHYNTDALFMELILGQSLSYTCAFFDKDNSSLEEAQRNKLQVIADRIKLKAGQTLLDLGTGWGYAPFPFAEIYGCHVTGITISQAQVAYCNQRKTASPAAERLRFVCADYASYEPTGRFEKVISVGMLEHVGKFQYKSFFDRIAQFLVEDGTALVHSMVDEREMSPDAWIDRNIFPGGYIPTISEVIDGIEHSDCELLQIYTHPKWHYFKTLQFWKDNLFEKRSQCESRLAEIGVGSHDAKKIIRIWEYFFSSSQLAFSDFGECRIAHFIVTRKR